MRPKKGEYGSVKFAFLTPDPTSPFLFRRDSDYRNLKKLFSERRYTNGEKATETVEKWLKEVASNV